MGNSNFFARNKPIITALAIVFALNMVMIFGFSLPLLSKLKSQKESLEKQKIIFENIRKDMTELRRFELITSKIEQNKYSLDQFVIKRDNIIAFIEEIERIAEETGNQISISEYKIPQKRKKKKPSDQKDRQEEKRQDRRPDQHLLLKIDGNYQNIFAFVYKIENMSYTILPISVDIKSRQAAAGKVNLKREEKDLPKDSISAEILIGVNFHE